MIQIKWSTIFFFQTTNDNCQLETKQTQNKNPSQKGTPLVIFLFLLSFCSLFPFALFLCFLLGKWRSLKRDSSRLYSFEKSEWHLTSSKKKKKKRESPQKNPPISKKERRKRKKKRKRR